MNRVVVITGTAPFSLGEAIATKILQTSEETIIIAIDKQTNWALQSALHAGWRGRFIQCDLNPLNYGAGPDAWKLFQEELQQKLNAALGYMGGNRIDVLYNNAGVYDSGFLDAMPHESVFNLLGVNLVGHIYVLRAVMEINKERGFDNAKMLRLCEIGSFQGISAREKRSVYCASKAAGIDFCQALDAGKELERVVYVAVPTLDTPMLHFNLWVTKVGAPKAFWQKLYQNQNSLDAYRKIFIECDAGKFEERLSSEPADTANALRDAFLLYQSTRREYFERGTAFPEEIADSAYKWMFTPHPVYLGATYPRIEVSSGIVTFKIYHFEGKRHFEERGPRSFVMYYKEVCLPDR